MKRLAALLPVAFLIVIAVPAYSQSLADLANKEKERRSEVKNDKVITDKEAEKYRSSSEAAAPAPDQSSTKADSPKEETKAETDSAVEKIDPNEPVDFKGRPESYWRKTMAEARKRVKDLENETNVLILARNELQNQFYNLDNGFQREEVQRSIQKNIYEQDLNKENLAKAKAALQDLENEARKSGALPGWIEARD